MLVSELNTRVSEILQDTENVTWTLPQLIEWVNDAVRALVLVKPDASNVVVSIKLAVGTRQSLSGSSDLRMISVNRNMGPTGTTIGRAIRLADKKSKDDFTPDWHTEASSTVVREYMFDEALPKVFWVSPPIPASPDVYVEASKSVLPSLVAVAGDTVPVDDIYAPPLIEWCCYRAFSRDSETTANWQRAARHFTAFFNLLQIKMQSDMSIDPRFRESTKKDSGKP